MSRTDSISFVDLHDLLTRRVEQTAELDKSLGDGSTLRETLLFQQRMYGFTDPRLKEKPLSYIAIPLWNTFWTLHNTRQATQFGFQPITYLEIDAYSRLMQAEFEPYEVEILKKMDMAFLQKLNTSKDTK
jgi:hypothetical protein